MRDHSYSLEFLLIVGVRLFSVHTRSVVVLVRFSCKFIEGNIVVGQFTDLFCSDRVTLLIFSSKIGNIFSLMNLLLS